MAPPARKRAKGDGGGSAAAADKHLPWMNARNQDLLSTDYVEIDPVNKADLDGDKFPSQIDFEYSALKPVLFGPMTKFAISGTFDVKKDAAAEWTAATGADVADVVLQFNWFEMLIKSLDVFHNNQRIASSNEQRFISAYLHTMLYAYMSPKSKRFFVRKQLTRPIAFRRKKMRGMRRPKPGKITPLTSSQESLSTLIFSPCFNFPSFSAATL